MGAWTFVRERIQELLPAGTTLGYAGRRASASPAVGSGRIHRREQAAFLEAAFAGLDSAGGTEPRGGPGPVSGSP